MYQRSDAGRNSVHYTKSRDAYRAGRRRLASDASGSDAIRWAVTRTWKPAARLGTPRTTIRPMIVGRIGTGGGTRRDKATAASKAAGERTKTTSCAGAGPPARRPTQSRISVEACSGIQACLLHLRRQQRAGSWAERRRLAASLAHLPDPPARPAPRLYYSLQPGQAAGRGQLERHRQALPWAHRQAMP